MKNAKQPEKADKETTPQDMLRRLMHRGGDEEDIEMHRVIEKLDDLLHQVDIIKNSATVPIGDYEALTRIYTGQSMYVDTRDISVAPHIMQRGVWEESVSKLLRTLLKPGDVFFDIGANFGYFSLLAGLEVDPKDKQIHIFEANPDLTKLIAKSLSINGLTKHSVLNNLAVSNKSGALTLHRMAGLWGSSTIRDEKDIKDYETSKETFDKDYKVKAVTLDNYVSEQKLSKVDVVKIDVEGVEDLVYEGMTKTIKKNADMIVLLEFTKAAYTEPKKFFSKLQSDFKYMYVVQEDNHLSPLENYTDLNEKYSRNEFVMFALSNNQLPSHY